MSLQVHSGKGFGGRTQAVHVVGIRKQHVTPSQMTQEAAGGRRGFVAARGEAMFPEATVGE
jgi:hypothetical protein